MQNKYEYSINVLCSQSNKTESKTIHSIMDTITNALYGYVEDVNVSSAWEYVTYATINGRIKQLTANLKIEFLQSMKSFLKGFRKSA